MSLVEQMRFRLLSWKDQKTKIKSHIYQIFLRFIMKRICILYIITMIMCKKSWCDVTTPLYGWVTKVLSRLKVLFKTTKIHKGILKPIMNSFHGSWIFSKKKKKKYEGRKTVLRTSAICGWGSINEKQNAIWVMPFDKKSC